MISLKNNNISYKIKMEKIIKKWWDEAASHYQNKFEIPIDDIYYGPFCPKEKDLKLINVDSIKGKRVLELGCGGGQCNVFLAKNGAICSGIDISKNQIEYAKKLGYKNAVKIDYHVGSSEDLSMFKSSEFDIVLSVFSMQYINNLKKCLEEVNRTLKKGGTFIFSLDHPFYSLMDSKTMKVENHYNSSLKENVKTNNIITKEEWHDGDKQKFVVYFRTISDFYNSLVEADFTVEKIIEPISFEEEDPWYKIYSKKLAKYIPPTIIFVVKK